MTTGKKGQTVETQRQGEVPRLELSAFELMSGMTSLKKRAFEELIIAGTCGTTPVAGDFGNAISKAVEDELKGLFAQPSSGLDQDINKTPRQAAGDAMHANIGGTNPTPKKIDLITRVVLNGNLRHMGSPILARLRSIQYVYATKRYVEFRLAGDAKKIAWEKTQSAVRKHIAGKESKSFAKTSKASDQRGGCPPAWEQHAGSWLTKGQKKLANVQARQISQRAKQLRPATPDELCQHDEFELAPIHCAALLGRFSQFHQQSYGEHSQRIAQTPAGSNVHRVREIKRISKHESMITLADFKDPASFSVSDFVNLASFAKTLLESTDELSAFLRIELSASTLKSLANCQESHADPAKFETEIIKKLNQLNESESIYNAARFSGIILRPETQALLRQNPQSSMRKSLNKLLLEDAFPREISHTNLNFNGFISKLQAGADPVSQFIFQKLRPQIKSEIPLVLSKKSPTTGLLNDINKALSDTKFPKSNENRSKSTTTEENFDSFWRFYDDHVDIDGSESAKKVKTIKMWIGTYDWNGILPDTFSQFVQNRVGPSQANITLGMEEALAAIHAEHADRLKGLTGSEIGILALTCYYFPYIAMQCASNIKAFGGTLPFEQNSFGIEREDVFNEICAEFGNVLAYDYDPFNTPVSEPVSKPASKPVSKSESLGNSIQRWAYHPTAHVLIQMLQKVGYTRHELKLKRTLDDIYNTPKDKNGPQPTQDKMIQGLRWTPKKLLNAEAVRQRSRISIESEVAREIPDGARTPDEIATRTGDGDLFVHLWRVANLNDLQRQIVLLLGVDNLGKEEIAVGAGVSAPHIAQEFNRAVKKLGLALQSTILDFTPAQIINPIGIINKLTGSSNRSTSIQTVLRKLAQVNAVQFWLDGTRRQSEKIQKIIITTAFNAFLKSSRNMEIKKVNRSLIDNAFGDFIIKNSLWDPDPTMALRKAFGRSLLDKDSRKGRPKGSTKAAIKKA